MNHPLPEDIKRLFAHSEDVKNILRYLLILLMCTIGGALVGYLNGLAIGTVPVVEAQGPANLTAALARDDFVFMLVVIGCGALAGFILGLVLCLRRE